MTQDRLLTSLNWRPMVGSAVPRWSGQAQEHREQQLIRMVRTSSGLSGAAARRRRIADIDDLGRMCELAANIVGNIV
jgi:hypothetical protein